MVGGASVGVSVMVGVGDGPGVMVGLAVGHLRARIRGDASPPARDCLPNGLVIRGSTARTPMPEGAREGVPFTKDQA